MDTVDNILYNERMMRKLANYYRVWQQADDSDTKQSQLNNTADMIVSLIELNAFIENEDIGEDFK